MVAESLSLKEGSESLFSHLNNRSHALVYPQGRSPLQLRSHGLGSFQRMEACVLASVGMNIS